LIIAQRIMATQFRVATAASNALGRSPPRL
jgi:hypothetical protein